MSHAAASAQRGGGRGAPDPREAGRAVGGRHPPSGVGTAAQANASTGATSNTFRRQTDMQTDRQS
eukprot:15484783-Alexandrium_andersonii.AAC.1